MILALAAFAWFNYVANGFAYGDVLGLPSQEAAATVYRFRAGRFLALALTAEAIGTATIVWQILYDQSRGLRILAAIGLSVALSVGTFELFRP